MPNHVVEQGEHTASIAHDYGFDSFRILYDHAENSPFRQERPDPNILCPGDQIYVPEKELKEESGVTEKRHRFQLLGDPLKLRLKLLTLDWAGYEGVACEMIGSGPAKPHETDTEGKIEQAITPKVEEVSLSFQEAPDLLEDELLLKVGHLDPITKQSGQAGRLRNLGYYRGEIPVADESAYWSAVEEFQCDHKLSVDGLCGPNTQAKLEEIYGC